MDNLLRPVLSRTALPLVALAALLGCGDSTVDTGGGGAGGAGGQGGATSQTSSGGAPQGGGGAAQGGGGAAQGGGGAAQGGGGAAQGGGGAAQGGGGAGGGDLCAGVTCTALDQCHLVGTCDESNGVCSNPAKANGTACDDGSGCAVGDTCQAGACVGASGNPSVDQSCLPTAGVIHVTPTQRPGQTFTVGATGQLTGIELALEKCTNAAASGSLRLDVLDGNGAVVASASLATSSITHDCTAFPLQAGTVGSGLFDLTSSCLAVTSGQTLRFELAEDGVPVGQCDTQLTHLCTAGVVAQSCTTNADCDEVFGASDTTTDLYAGGTAVVNGTAQTGFDLDFKTFVR